MLELPEEKRTRVMTVAIIVAAVLVGTIGIAFFALSVRDPHGSYHEVTIASGTGARDIARILKEEGIVRSGLGFSFFARLTGRADELKAGKYLLCPCQSIPELVSVISGGRGLSDDIQVTIPEGVNIWELDRILTASGLIEEGAIRSAFSSKEGRLFPETYRFANDATAEDIIRIMEETYADRADASEEAVLIVASMLEKEAKTADDMALVAGIMFKRLALGMPLQIDATVAYGWCVRTVGFRSDCDVTDAPIATEIKRDGPYNTYTRTGLPDRPISNPGERALRAAANPKTSDYLYYLSTRDGSQIIYSKTLEEHLENRAKHLGF